MPVSASQHRVTSGAYQKRWNDNVKNTLSPIRGITVNNLALSDEICRAGTHINQAINSYEERCRLSPANRVPSSGIAVPLLMLLSQVRLTDRPPDNATFISDKDISLPFSENTTHPDSRDGLFNTLLKPVENIFYETGKFISRHDPLKFPAADAVSFFVTDAESVKTADLNFLSDDVARKIRRIISSLRNDTEITAVKNMLNELKNITIEAEENFPPEFNNIDHLIYLIDRSKNTIDKFEIEYGLENLCESLKLQRDHYIEMINNLPDDNSKLRFKQYLESLPSLIFTPDPRGDAYPSVESQIADNLVKSVFWFEHEQGHSAAYSSRYDAYKSLLTCLLAEKNIGSITSLPDNSDNREEAIRLVNFFFREAESNLKNKGEAYLLESANIFYLSLRDGDSKRGTLNIKGLEKKALVSYSDKDKLLLLRYYYNQPIEIEYNQEPHSQHFFKLLDFLITIQCVAEAMHPGYRSANIKNSYGHHYKSRNKTHRIGDNRQQRNIENLKLEYDSNAHRLTIYTTHGSKKNLKENNLKMKKILEENERIDKIIFKIKINSLLGNKKNHSYLSREMKNKMRPEMYAKNVHRKDLSLPDLMGLRHDANGNTFLKLHNNFIKIKHLTSHPDIKNRYYIKDSNNHNMYFRFRKDGKFHSESFNERIYVNTKIGFGGKVTKATPLHNDLNSDERSALRAYGRTTSNDINKFMREGMPEHHLTPYSRKIMMKMIDDIQHALSKIPPYEGVVYRGTTITKKHFSDLKKDRLVTNNAFLACSKNQDVAKKYSIPFIGSRDSILYEFNIKKTGHPIDKYTDKRDEEEILLESNKYFKIRDINSKKIVFDEVDSSLLSAGEKAIANNIDF